MKLFHENKTPKEEMETRIGALQAALSKANIDAAIIVQNADLFYFSGTIQRGYLLIPSHGDPVFAVTGDISRVKRESSIEKIERITSLKEIPAICSGVLPSSQPYTLGLELDVLPVSLYNRICSIFQNSRPVDISSIIRNIRMIKTPYEIDKIRASATIFAEAISHLPQILKPGMTEVDLESELIRMARRRSHFGAIRIREFNQEGHYGHVLAGPRGAVPSMMNSPTGGLGPTPAFGYGASYCPIEENSPILIDLCFGIEGYIADQTRTAVIGKLPDFLLEAYERLLSLKKEIEKQLHPGAICEEIYFKALEIAETKGLSDNFMGHGPLRPKFIGHGIGLELDEWPVLGKGFRAALEPGMVLAFEPKLIFPEIGAIGLEDDYVITEDGYEKITPLDESIISV